MAAEPRPRRTLQLIQVFRAAAATMVMLYHVTNVNHFYFPFSNYAFLFGHSGVDFFFILSGFIMLYVHHDQAARPAKAWRFLALRALRIYPLYWCVLAVTVACIWLHPPTAENMWAPPAGKALATSTLARAALLYHQDVDAIVPIAWTLSYELVFYAFFVCYILFGAAIFAALAWCGAIVVQWGRLAYLGPYGALLRPVIVEFFLGCIAAAVVLRLGGRRVSGWWLVAALAPCAAVAFADVAGLVDPYKWYALPFFCLILAGGAYDQGRRRAYPRVLLLLGDASYAIYLLHYGVIVLFAQTVDYYRAPASVAPNVTLAVLALAILAFAVAVHRFVERPLLLAGRRWIED